jgi:hypothetical protein
MRESCLYGSVRGDRGNPVPYRDHARRNPSTMIAKTLNGMGLGLKVNIPPTRSH